jgi:hypothetical protein
MEIHSLVAIPYSQRHETSRKDKAQGWHLPFGLRKARTKHSEAKRRQTQCVFCRAVRARPRLKREAHDCRRSTAVLVPRSLSSQGTQPQAMLPGTRPVCLTGFPRPCLSQSSDCTSRPGPSAEGLMPKAARERVASPPAGTALARAIRLCLPDRVRLGEIRICN